MGVKNMIHLNHHMLASIDTETSGLIPGHHEIVQLAILPLDNNLEPRKDVPMFDCYIRPRYPNRCEVHNRRVFDLAMKHGIPGDKAFDLFEVWYQSLNLPVGKRIVPLGCNYAFDRDMLVEWAGRHNYNHYFDSRYRDINVVAQYWNDRSDFHANPCPFHRETTLSAIARIAGVEIIEKNLHDAIYDAMITAQSYKYMVLETLL